MRLKIYLLVPIIFLLAGCLVKPAPKVKSTEWQNRQMAAKPLPNSVSVDDLLKYYQRINGLSGQDFRDELVHGEKDRAVRETVTANLRLVLLLLHGEGNSHKRDLGRAGSLLANIDKLDTAPSESVRGFISLLKGFIVEQKKLQLKIIGLNNSQHTLLQKNHKLEQKLKDTEQRAAVSAKKIEQLKKIEQIMSKRQD